MWNKLRKAPPVEPVVYTSHAWGNPLKRVLNGLTITFLSLQSPTWGLLFFNFLLAALTRKRFTNSLKLNRSFIIWFFPSPGTIKGLIMLKRPNKRKQLAQRMDEQSFTVQTTQTKTAASPSDNSSAEQLMQLLKDKAELADTLLKLSQALSL